MAFNFREHLIPGSLLDCQSWIEQSNLQTETKLKLRNFTNKFPSLVFYKNDEAILNRREETEKITFPLWFREVRKTLAYVLPDERDVLFQINSCDGWSPRADDIHNVWYSFGMIGYSNDEHRKMLLSANSLFPIGYGESSTLAISLTPDSSSIYEYNDNDLLDDLAEDVSPNVSVYKIFDVYEDLFAHIVAFKLPDGQILRASN